MKSAIEWLMGKSDSFTVCNEINSSNATAEVSLYNGDYNREVNHLPHCTNSNSNEEEKSRSPWGQTLTPRRAKIISPGKSRSGVKYNSFGNSSSDRNMPALTSWEDISLSSDILSPGFASRIVKESRSNSKRISDMRRDQGPRRYPVGQEKFIKAGVLPNVRLKGRAKAVITPKRKPTSFLPVASSPFAANLTSSFLASTTPRLTDISSVVASLDSEPSTSACDTIEDPTNVRAVVSALEQAQALKSGIKRSRFGEGDDSNKKQRYSSNTDSEESAPDYATPIMNQVFNSGTKRTRTLDGSTSEDGGSPIAAAPSQLSPENKRRCIPDPRIASFSSFKNVHSLSPSFPGSGRGTPYSAYDSQQDSDSESNRSLDSRQSRLSDKSSKNYETNLARNSEQVDVPADPSSQPQSGVFGLGGRSSNGSSTPSLSRTTTPSSRLSHTFSIEAYRQDKAKSHQRLNKMLGMLFNVPEEEIEAKNREIAPVSSVPIASFASTPIAFTTAPVTSNEISVSSVSTVNSDSNSLSSSLLISQTSKPISSSIVERDSSSKDNVTEAEKLDSTKTSPTVSSEISSKSQPISFSLNSNVTSVQSSDTACTSSCVSFVGSMITSSSNKDAIASSSLTSVQSSAATSLLATNVHSSSHSISLPLETSYSDVISSMPASSISSTNPLKSLAETTFSINKDPVFSFGSAKSSDNSLAPSGLFNSTSQTTTAPTSLGLFTFGSSTGSPSTASTSSSALLTPSFSFPSATQTSSTSTGLLASSSSQVLGKEYVTNTSKPLFSFGSEKETNKDGLFSFGSSQITSKAGDTQINKTLFTFGSSQEAGKGKESEKESLQSKVSSLVSSAPAFTFSSTSSSVTIQASSASSVFSFGSSSLINPASATSSATTNATNLFSFGSSAIGSANFKSPEPEKRAMDKQPPPFSFPIAEQKSSFNASASSSSGLFGSGSTFTFGSDANKVSTNPLQSSIAVSTQASATSSLFTFGNSKAASTSDTSPFSFGSNSTPKTTPQFGATPGGGFSFGSNKSSTLSSSNVPAFGTPSTSVSASFTFKPPSKSSAGFDFGAPKATAANEVSSVFSFGSDAAPSTQSSRPMFGSSPPSGVGMFGSSVSKPSTTAFAFGSPQAPGFSSTGGLSSNPSKSMFGGMNNASTGNSRSDLFGAAAGSSTTSPFNVGPKSQSASPFNVNDSSAPSMGSTFGSNPPSVALPGQAPNSVQSSPFAFGSQNSPTSVFQFGSQGGPNPAASAVPSFGSSAPGMFSFGSGTPAPAGVNSNPFNIAPSPASPASTRTFVTARRMRNQHKRK